MPHQNPNIFRRLKHLYRRRTLPTAWMVHKLNGLSAMNGTGLEIGLRKTVLPIPGVGGRSQSNFFTAARTAARVGGGVGTAAQIKTNERRIEFFRSMQETLEEPEITAEEDEALKEEKEEVEIFSRREPELVEDVTPGDIIYTNKSVRGFDLIKAPLRLALKLLPDKWEPETVRGKSASDIWEETKDILRASRIRKDLIRVQKYVGGSLQKLGSDELNLGPTRNLTAEERRVFREFRGESTGEENGITR